MYDFFVTTGWVQPTSGTDINTNAVDAATPTTFPPADLAACATVGEEEAPSTDVARGTEEKK